MTKNEAIKFMKEGMKLSHKHFTNEEWVKMGLDGQMILEDGVECSPEDFWRWRQDKSWDNDWKFYFKNS